MWSVMGSPSPQISRALVSTAVVVIGITAACAVQADPPVHATDLAGRPNILWIVVEDMSADFGCYGETTIETPHVDRLAREGTRFAHAYVTAPVCSPSRSAMITGMYQTTIGAHHHRSGRGTEKIRLPAGVRPVPELFREAGYFTCLGGEPIDPARTTRRRPGALATPRLGKTDYNFVWDPAMYDAADWAGRRPGQPFFMQVMLPGGKLRGADPERSAAIAARAAAECGRAVSPADVTLPPYLPRAAVLLADQAAYLDAVRLTDAAVGRLLTRLEAEGILDETLIIFMTDHGISHVRGKQFLYDEGTRVPFIVRGPGIPAGGVREDLVEHIDMAAVSLAAAGLPIPGVMQGRDLFAPDATPRSYAFAARDRCDETVDRIRSVRTDRHLYIRNFHPGRPLLQPNDYKDKKAILVALRDLHEQGRLDAATEGLLFSPTRPAEELYDWRADPWQLVNLAADAAHRDTLEALRSRLDAWMEETGDLGPEADEMYDSDMIFYVGAGKPEVERNIRIMKRWAAEGR
jgi:arylsulfatase A-like enzyme